MSWWKDSKTSPGAPLQEDGMCEVSATKLAQTSHGFPKSVPKDEDGFPLNCSCSAVDIATTPHCFIHPQWCLLGDKLAHIAVSSSSRAKALFFFFQWKKTLKRYLLSPRALPQTHSTCSCIIKDVVHANGKFLQTLAAETPTEAAGSQKLYRHLPCF